MFELMGYRHAGLGELVLEGPIDPDKVSNVSRDAIVAFVECQVVLSRGHRLLRYLPEIKTIFFFSFYRY